MRMLVDIGYVAPLTLYSIEDVERFDLAAKLPQGWDASWLVVGRDSICGDPIVLKLDSSPHPVAIASAATGLGSHYL